MNHTASSLLKLCTFVTLALVLTPRRSRQLYASRARLFCHPVSGITRRQYFRPTKRRSTHIRALVYIYMKSFGAKRERERDFTFVSISKGSQNSLFLFLKGYGLYSDPIFLIPCVIAVPVEASSCSGLRRILYMATWLFEERVFMMSHYHFWGLYIRCPTVGKNDSNFSKKKCHQKNVQCDDSPITIVRINCFWDEQLYVIALI